MLLILILSLFPKYPSEINFKIEEKGEIKVYSEDDKFRLDFKGKKLESYYVEKGKILLFQDGKWKEIKKPLYNEDNFVISIFFGKEEGLEIEKETGEDGLKKAQVKSTSWGMAKLERVEIKKLKEIPEDLFPKKSKSPLNLSKFKSLLTGEDEKEVSATAGARGVGEEENLDAEPNYSALLEIEKIKISKEEVEKFAKEGGLK